MSVEISLLNKLYGNLGYWLVFTFILTFYMMPFKVQYYVSYCQFQKIKKKLKYCSVI